MAKYLSNTQRNLTLGVKDYTDFENVLTVIGNANISGNLFVGGDKFLIDTENVTLRDPLIELGLITDPNTGELTPPTQNLGNDVGIVLNYFDTAPGVNSAQKAAMYYDNEDGRMKFVRQATLIGNSVIANAFAALEIGSLWLNDCAGKSPVIECDQIKNERLLKNISIDCGVYI